MEKGQRRLGIQSKSPLSPPITLRSEGIVSPKPKASQTFETHLRSSRRHGKALQTEPASPTNSLPKEYDEYMRQDSMLNIDDFYNPQNNIELDDLTFEKTDMTEKDKGDRHAKIFGDAHIGGMLSIGRVSAAMGKNNDMSVSHVTKLIQKRKRRKQRRLLYRGLVAFIVFMALFLIIAFMQRGVGFSHWLEVSMKDAIAEEEFSPEDAHIYKSFHDIGEVSEFWQWMSGPLIGALSSLNSKEEAFILRYNRLLGSVRIRQCRVQRGTCEVTSSLKKFFTDSQGLICYGHWSGSKEERAPFGPVDEPKKYVWQETPAPSSIGELLHVYPGNGYVIDLEYNPIVAAEQVQKLQEDAWIDGATRFVIVTINIYNPHTNYFMSSLFSMEIHPSGALLTRQEFRPFRATLYFTNSDMFRLGCEILFGLSLIMWIVYTIVEMVREHRDERSSVWQWLVSPFWNLLAVINLVFFLTLSIWYIVFVLELNDFRGDIDDLNRDSAFTRMEDLGRNWGLIYSFASVNLFLTVLLIFRYTSLNPRFQVLWMTLMNAGPDLFAFMVFFFIVFIGFVTTAHMLFGPDVKEYSTYAASFITAWGLMLGQFDYPPLAASNRVMAPLFFITYVMLIVLILLNMFLAIIDNAFEATKERINEKVCSFLFTFLTKKKLERR